MKIKCNYCNNNAIAVTGTTIYPHRKDLAKLKFWYCDNKHAAAYVGCHKNTAIPLGRLADADLRYAKSQAHLAFDPLWKNKDNIKSRSAAYYWLSKKLGISQHECHIGMFDIAQCWEVIKCADEFLEEKTIRDANATKCECCSNTLSSDLSNNVWCVNNECLLYNKCYSYDYINSRALAIAAGNKPQAKERLLQGFVNEHVTMS